MKTYEVMLGVDKAAHDTGRRMTMQVRESDPLSAAIKAEELADRDLEHPGLEYTHAMRVRPLLQLTPLPMDALPLAEPPFELVA